MTKYCRSCKKTVYIKKVISGPWVLVLCSACKKQLEVY